MGTLHQQTMNKDRHVRTIRLADSRLTARILDYGARLARLRFDGTDLVLRLPDPSDYLQDTTCMGGIIGRNANRIHPADCTIDGTTYRLTHNDGENNNHSGPHGFEDSFWAPGTIEEDRDHDLARLALRLKSPDMSQGFPGNLISHVIYTLVGPSLVIDLLARSDRTTVCNMTTHIYWNLDGDGCTALNDVLTIPTEFFFPADDTFIPLAPRPVIGTHFDLRPGQGRPLWKALGFDPATGDTGRPEDLTDPLLIASHGYNHAFDFTPEHRHHPDRLLRQAVLESPASGIRMAVSSNAPSLLVYSAGFFSPGPATGGDHQPFAGLALEPGFVPNSINETFNGRSDRPILKAGQSFHLRIRYDFSHSKE